MQLGENINVAFLGLIDHKFRSFLTMLGIIFGTASVIAMVAIGEGAKKQAIAKYQDLGVSNIIIRDKDLADKELEEVKYRPIKIKILDIPAPNNFNKKPVPIITFKS